MTLLPMCRCLDCNVEFRQPWINYVWLDCPKCRAKKKLPLKWEPPPKPAPKAPARKKLKR